MKKNQVIALNHDNNKKKQKKKEVNHQVDLLNVVSATYANQTARRNIGR